MKLSRLSALLSSMPALERFLRRPAGSNAASTTGKYGEYLTPAEARNVLFAYIKSEGLEHPTVSATPSEAVDSTSMELLPTFMS